MEQKLSYHEVLYDDTNDLKGSYHTRSSQFLLILVMTIQNHQQELLDLNAQLPNETQRFVDSCGVAAAVSSW